MLDSFKKWRYYRKFVMAATAAAGAAVWAWWPDHHISPEEATGIVFAALGAIGVVVVPNKRKAPAASEAPAYRSSP